MLVDVLIQNKCELTLLWFFFPPPNCSCSFVLNKILQSHSFGYNPQETVLKGLFEHGGET